MDLGRVTAVSEMYYYLLGVGFDLQIVHRFRITTDVSEVVEIVDKHN